MATNHTPLRAKLEEFALQLESASPFAIIYTIVLFELTLAIACYRPVLAILSLFMFAKYKRWQFSSPDPAAVSNSANLKMGAFYASLGCIVLAGIAEHDIFLALLVAFVIAFFELSPYIYSMLPTALPITNPPSGQAVVG